MNSNTTPRTSRMLSWNQKNRFSSEKPPRGCSCRRRVTYARKERRSSAREDRERGSRAGTENSALGSSKQEGAGETPPAGSPSRAQPGRTDAQGGARKSLQAPSIEGPAARQGRSIQTLLRCAPAQATHSRVPYSAPPPGAQTRPPPHIPEWQRLFLPRTTCRGRGRAEAAADGHPARPSRDSRVGAEPPPRTPPACESSPQAGRGTRSASPTRCAAATGTPLARLPTPAGDLRPLPGAPRVNARAGRGGHDGVRARALSPAAAAAAPASGCPRGSPRPGAPGDGGTAPVSRREGRACRGCPASKGRERLHSAPPRPRLSRPVRRAERASAGGAPGAAGQARHAAGRNVARPASSGRAIPSTAGERASPARGAPPSMGRTAGPRTGPASRLRAPPPSQGRSPGRPPLCSCGGPRARSPFPRVPALRLGASARRASVYNPPPCNTPGRSRERRGGSAASSDAWVLGAGIPALFGLHCHASPRDAGCAKARLVLARCQADGGAGPRGVFAVGGLPAPGEVAATGNAKVCRSLSSCVTSPPAPRAPSEPFAAWRTGSGALLPEP